MKKLQSLPESDFLKILFGYFTFAALLAAVIMPDRSNMLSGLYAIISQPSKVSTNYFAVGGYAGTFLNMGLVGFACLSLYVLFDAKANNVSTLAFILTLGFTTWGINILNMWPTVLGVVLYCVIRRDSLSANVNAMLFSTGIAPIITDLMVRYPNAEWVGFNPAGIALAVVIGLGIGYFLPGGLVHSPKVHKGFDLYSAAVPVGMTSFLLQGALYKSLGVALPAGPAAETLQVGSRMLANVYCGILFGVMILAALAMGCTPKKYLQMIRDDDVSGFSGEYGNAPFLMNVGVFGLFILGYYNLIGASFNGVTFGIMFCMLATCNSGSSPRSVFPILLGYLAASWVCQFLSAGVGGSFTGAINAQPIIIGVCYANGLSPITRKYGWSYAMLASVMHYCMVTTVPSLHGGFCLYNGGFTAAFVCLLLIPILERLAVTKAEKKTADNVLRTE